MQWMELLAKSINIGRSIKTPTQQLMKLSDVLFTRSVSVVPLMDNTRVSLFSTTLSSSL